MKASLEWLQQFVNLKDMPLDKLAEDISLSVAEVESVDSMKIFDIRIGEIKSVKKIEKSTKLHHAQVDVGDKNNLSIIFGGYFPMKKGDRVPVAVAPTLLPTGTKIERKEMFSIVSEGMLVADDEMGLNLTTEGILRFNKSTKIGQNIFYYLKFSDSLNLSITTNRADLLSIQGIARDLSAIYKKKFTSVTIPKLNFEDKELDQHFSIKIKCSDSLKRYAAIKLSGLKNANSPDWMQKRLLSAGLRSINAIVDCTNYCMLELGQPLHAFDYEKISEIDVDRGHHTGLREITVRKSLGHEKFDALDEVKREIPVGAIVIADSKKILALGGIIGGLGSSISENTSQIVLESAVFDPALIRKTSKTLNISTDASYRFERGVDEEATVTALKHAAGLILEICGGKITSKIFDFPNRKSTIKNKIIFSLDRYESHTGTSTSIENAATILQKLGFQISKKSKKNFETTPPSWRKDISIEEDLYEEILRISNFNSIPETFISGQFSPPQPNAFFDLENQTASLLASLGWQEALTYSFYSSKNIRESQLPAENHIQLLNPLGYETAYLRASLLPGLLSALAKNVNVIEGSIKFFEIGHIFQNNKGHLHETSNLTALIACDNIDKAISEARLAIDQVYYLLNKTVTIKMTDDISADIIMDDKSVGTIEVVDLELIRFDRKKRKAITFSLSLTELVKLPKTQATYVPINPFPSIDRDVTFVTPKQCFIGPILGEIIDLDDLIVDVKIIDNFKNTDHKTALTIRISYASDLKTLNDDEVNALHQSLIKKIAQKYKFKIK